MLVFSRTSETAYAENKSFQIDGSYQEWSNVPHAEITYNSWNDVCHNQVGLYMDGDYLYVHIKMHHLYGMQLPLNYMLLKVNGSSSFALSMHYPDQNRNVDWSKDWQIYNMPEGTTTAIAAFSDGSYDYLGEAAYTSYTADHALGDELEYRVSLEMISKITRVPKESIGWIEMTFPNIGAGSVSISGTSTGAVVGIGLSIAMAGGGFLLLYKKGKKKGRKEACIG